MSDGWSGCGYPSECTHPSCCARYGFNLIIASFALLSLIVAVGIGVVWVLVQYRPNRNVNRPAEDGTAADEEVADIELKNFEETRYLRRFSEMNPLGRRHSIEM